MQTIYFVTKIFTNMVYLQNSQTLLLTKYLQRKVLRSLYGKKQAHLHCNPAVLLGGAHTTAKTTVMAMVTSRFAVPLHVSYRDRDRHLKSIVP